MKSSQKALVLLIGLVFLSTSALAQTPSRDGSPVAGRIVGTAAGIVGGFLLGWSISDDDAVNSGQLLGRNIAISAVALGAAGYFAGRAIDKRASWRRPVDPAVKNRIQSRIVDEEVSKLKRGPVLTLRN